jgi:hypothetical protein
MANVLTQLLVQHTASRYTGRFELRKTEDTYHIVPTARRNQQGAEERHYSILDAELPLLKAGEHSAFDRVEEIASLLAQASGVDVRLGAAPLNLLINTGVSQGPAGQSARSVLLRTLDITGRRLSWQVLYDPGPSGAYFLNIHSVP